MPGTGKTSRIQDSSNIILQPSRCRGRDELTLYTINYYIHTTTCCKWPSPQMSNWSFRHNLYHYNTTEKQHPKSRSRLSLWHLYAHLRVILTTSITPSSTLIYILYMALSHNWLTQCFMSMSIWLYYYMRLKEDSISITWEIWMLWPGSWYCPLQSEWSTGKLELCSPLFMFPFSSSSLLLGLDRVHHFLTGY